MPIDAAVVDRQWTRVKSIAEYPLACFVALVVTIKIIDVEGYTCKSADGGLYQHPCVGVMNKQRDAFIKLAKEFGLVGPTSREDI